MSGMIHRAKQALEAVGRAYPDAWRIIERARSLKGEGLPDWPDWCYMPIAGGSTVASDRATGQVPLLLSHHPAIITALATWRMTQGIYRFDPDVFEAVASTPLDGNLPTELLYRLPEWCVYLELDGSLRWESQPVRGAWVHLECDVVRHGAHELRIVFDCTADPDDPLRALKGLWPMPILLDQPDIERSIAAVYDSGRKLAAQHGFAAPPGIDLETTAAVLRPVISLVLYLCSQTAEVSHRGRADRKPGNPEPKRTRRKGWRTFPADGPTQWDVGVRMGAALRTAYRADEAGSDLADGKSKRPHVRRAHWHTFLSGKRKRSDGTVIPSGQRRRELRWLPPIAVNLDDVDQLPATIRQVD